MGRITITYRTYPNCPEATEYSLAAEKVRYFVGIFANLFGIALIGWYFSLVFDLFAYSSANLVDIISAFWGAAALWYVLYCLASHHIDAHCRVIITKARAAYESYDIAKLAIKKVNAANQKVFLRKTRNYFYYALFIFAATFCATGIVAAIYMAYITLFFILLAVLGALIGLFFFLRSKNAPAFSEPPIDYSFPQAPTSLKRRCKNCGALVPTNRDDCKICGSTLS